MFKQIIDSSVAYRAHEGVQYTCSEGCATREWLRHEQLCVWIILIILVQKLHVGVVTCTHQSNSRPLITSLKTYCV